MKQSPSDQTMIIGDPDAYRKSVEREFSGTTICPLLRKAHEKVNAEFLSDLQLQNTIEIQKEE
jgi:hypothetical protein